MNWIHKTQTKYILETFEWPVGPQQFWPVCGSQLLSDGLGSGPGRRAGPVAIPIPLPMAAFWAETLGLSLCCGSGVGLGMLLPDLSSLPQSRVAGRTGH